MYTYVHALTYATYGDILVGLDPGTSSVLRLLSK